ncbi:MAG: hypothetical protein ACTHU0_38690 [Kofleriaceae bacterium]
MGVEYKHALHVVDPSWKASWDHVLAIHAVLEKWELASVAPEKPDGSARDLRVDFGLVGGKPVATVLGGSQYGVDDEDRYVRIHAILAGFGAAAEPEDDEGDDFDDDPPKRSGLILDCGKDLPSIAEEATETPGENTKPLPAKAFVADLEQAFGTKLVEQGWIY